MQSRSSARAIPLSDEGVLLIKRIKNGREYWVTPGGGIEEGEGAEDAMRRELREELGVEVVDARLILKVRSEVKGVLQNDSYFEAKLASKFGGKILGPESARADEHNVYEPTNVSLDRLEEINLVPKRLKEVIRKLLQGDVVEFEEIELGEND